jgi:hypothetical protein
MTPFQNLNYRSSWYTHTYTLSPGQNTITIDHHLKGWSALPGSIQFTIFGHGGGYLQCGYFAQTFEDKTIITWSPIYDQQQITVSVVMIPTAPDPTLIIWEDLMQNSREKLFGTDKLLFSLHLLNTRLKTEDWK